MLKVKGISAAPTFIEGIVIPDRDGQCAYDISLIKSLTPPGFWGKLLTKLLNDYLKKFDSPEEAVEEMFYEVYGDKENWPPSAIRAYKNIIKFLSNYEIKGVCKE